MTKKVWRKVSSAELFAHPRVPIREDTVLLPTGEQTTYTLLDLPDAVTVVIQKDDTFLLNLEYAYPVDDTIHRPHDVTSEGMLFKFPGGMLKPSETFQAAAAREVEEETGIQIGNITLLAAVRNFFPRSNSRDYKVLASVKETGAPNRDAEESGMEHVWKSAAEIDALIRAEDPRVLHSHFLDTWELYKTTQRKDM